MLVLKSTYTHVLIGGSNERMALSSALLHVCRVIHQEAAPALYRANLFVAIYPLEMDTWFQLIGANNASLLLHSLWLLVSDLAYQAKEDGWVRVFRTFAGNAKRLRHISIRFCKEPCLNRELGNGEKFVQVLAKIKGLDTLTISGLFSSAWST